MRQKRIFIINQADESQNYGVGKYIYEISEEVKNRKESYQLISVVLGCSNKTKIERKVEENVTYLEIPKPYFYKNGMMGVSERYSKGSFFILNDLFEINESDVFHFNSNMQHFIIKAVKEHTSAKIIYSIHISLWKVFYKNDKELFWSEWNDIEKVSKSKEDIKAEIKNCELADTIICLTDTMAKDVIEMYEIPENKIRKIENGIGEIKNKITKKKKDLLRNELKFTTEDFVLLYVGRLNAQKGVSCLITSFKEIVRDNCKNIKLLVVGDGADKENLISQCNEVSEHVIFKGYISPKIIDQYYQISDAMVFPSLNEQSSYVMLEAMQNKVAMIVTDIPAFDVLDDKKTCLKTELKELNNINQVLLTETIKLLIDDRAIRKEISNNAYNLFRAKFTSKRMFEKTYGELIAEEVALL